MKFSNYIIIFIYLLLSYPLFYYAYKFGNPDFGNVDFYNYYHFYKDWDFKNIVSPFNTRLVSSFFIFLFNKIGFFYNAEINYHNPYIDQKVFFNAIFFNYICFIANAYLIYRIILKFFSNYLVAFIFGILTFLSFGALFYSLNTLTESFSVLLFSLIFFLYLKKSYWVLPFLLLATIQREYIFLVMAPVSLIHFLFLKTDRKYFSSIFICSIIGFAAYYILRKTFFYTPQFDSQLDVTLIFNKLFHSNFPMGEYIRQSFLNQNIFLLYLFVVAYKYFKKMAFDKINLIVILVLYFETHFVSIVEELGNSCGRYFYITLAMLLFYLAKEIKPLFSSHLNFSENV